MGYKSKASLGFTLVELMITVAIVAILAAVAFPSYQQQVRKGARGAAQSFLLDIANREQQYMLDQRSFTATIGTGGLQLTQPSETNGRYTFAVDITVPAGPPPCFTVTATAVGAQAPDGPLTLTCGGVKTRNGSSGW